jgi:hypothetical protein
VTNGPKKNSVEAKVFPDSEARAILGESAKLESTYSVIFVGNQKPWGSGTLVSVAGLKGILTAHHVVRELYKLPDEEISLCYRNGAPHRPRFDRSLFPVVTIGDSSKNANAHTGPDMAFVILLDPQLMSALERIKSFYSVDNKDYSICNQDGLTKMPWTLSGSPMKFSEPLGIHRGEPLTKFSDYHAEVDFLNFKNRKGFDYIRLKTEAPSEHFPETYGGVSGGGIWLTVVQHSKMPKVKETYGVPVLLGVAFYETAPKKGQRVIIGHGPRSIYERLCADLAKWRH